MPDRSAIPRHAPMVRTNEVVESRIEDTIIMMSVQSGNYFTLENTGGRIWTLLEKPCTFDEVVASLMDEYDVSKEVCEADLAQLLGKMMEHDLIRFAGPAGA